MILYLIPARGGSKRLPGKNLRELAGIPLVAHAIRRARGAARLVGGEYRIVVSTDSPEIAAVAREWGAEVVDRPGILASDSASSESVALHALTALGHEGLVVLVQPTSPLADAGDLAGLVGTAQNLRTHGAAVGRGGDPNGEGYATWAPLLLAGLRFVNEGTFYYHPRRERPDVDIDTEQDWRHAEALLAARPVAPFEIAGRKIGLGQPCFVIAEAGINHGGDVLVADELVWAAAEAGADAVKFQAFDPETLAESGPHRDLLMAHRLGRNEYERLAADAERTGLCFLVSAFDEGSVDLVNDLVPAHKIPSGEIINLPLLRHVASKGKPVILSTGMATMVEIDRALDALSGVPVALLHCVSEYPTFPDRANLRAIQTLRQAFWLPVGWSDHSPRGSTLGYQAVCLGAAIHEQHLALEGYEGPDAAASCDPDDFRKVVRFIRLTEQALGDGRKAPTPGELETAKVARRIDGLRRNAH